MEKVGASGFYRTTRRPAWSGMAEMACYSRKAHRLEFKLSIGFVHPGGFMLGWFMGQMMEQGFRPFGVPIKRISSRRSPRSIP
jgi:hypothetical protein